MKLSLLWHLKNNSILDVNKLVYESVEQVPFKLTSLFELTEQYNYKFTEVCVCVCVLLGGWGCIDH